MANTKHIAGPWAMKEQKQISSGITIVDANGRKVCNVPPSESDLDNARLIAAAPDLLAALEAISAALDRVGYPMAIRDEVNAMDDAIAKATA